MGFEWLHLVKKQRKQKECFEQIQLEIPVQEAYLPMDDEKKEAQSSTPERGAVVIDLYGKEEDSTETI